jgi:lipoprotein signal peptidase
MNSPWRSNLKKYLYDYAVLFSFSGLIVLLDQLTKNIVRANLGNYEIYRPDLWLTQYVRIFHIHNTGAAFGLFQRFGGVFTFLSFVVGIFILYYFPQIPDDRVSAWLCVCNCGAVGNLLDRINHGMSPIYFHLELTGLQPGRLEHFLWSCAAGHYDVGARPREENRKSGGVPRCRPSGGRAR